MMGIELDMSMDRKFFHPNTDKGGLTQGTGMGRLTPLRATGVTPSMKE